ncbi:MAG: hypothetical protein LBE12_06600 [Planctomycetaceae bacterium]|nr:hypothetical protein [Planctomycetaceae bacterium]
MRVDSVRKRNYYRFGSNPLAALSTLNFPLSTIILPFQGEDLCKLKKLFH